MRARGLGVNIENPITTCAEENLLGYEKDNYHNEDLIHEFAHTMHGLAIMLIDTAFHPLKDFCFRLPSKMLYMKMRD